MSDSGKNGHENVFLLSLRLRLRSSLRQRGSCVIHGYPALALRLADARLGTVPGYYLPRLAALRSRA
jgi:hypothetical protein